MLALSCVQQEAPVSGEGTLTLAVDVPQTKAAMSADALLQSATVKIYYADFSGLVRSYTYATAPEKIWLPANEYRVDVEAGEAVKTAPAVASWEQKSYKGSSPFSIVAGSNTSVTVNAKVNNAVSKVSFDKSVADNFKAGYSLTIGLDKEDAATQLDYNAAKSGAEGYFIIKGIDEPSFSWTFNGTLSDGTPFVKEGTIPAIEAGRSYSLNLKYTVKDGLGTFELLVDYSTEVIEDIIVFQPLSTGLSASSIYEIWAGHATVHADVDESEYSDPSAVKFAYSKNGSDWTTVSAVRSSEGVYDAVLKNLDPATEYSYKLVIAGEEIGDPMSFTTEAAPAVPNGSFEETSKSQSGNFMEFYNASAANPADRTAWWGSGNGSSGVDGSADFGGFIICKPDTAEKVDGNQSACLASTWALVKFAAGNLFSGYFGGLVGTKGGMVYFGRPFTGRPTAVKVWAKYSAGVMDRINGMPDGVKLEANKTYDTGRIQVALGTWDYKKYGGNKECPILVNTTDVSTFVDFAVDNSTIAFGDLQLQSDSSDPYNKWVEYTIPIEYNSDSEYPSYIVVSCAASKYGDYFSGCSTSKLWIDKFELVYE